MLWSQLSQYFITQQKTDLFENVFIILSETRCFSTCRLLIVLRLSLVNLAIMSKLQFICIKTELVYIGGQSATSFNEHGTWVNQNCNYNYLTREEAQIPKGCHFSGPPSTCISMHVVVHVYSQCLELRETVCSAAGYVEVVISCKK